MYKRFYAQILLSIKIKPKFFFCRKLTISHWLYHRLSPFTSFLFKYLNFLGLRKILVFGVLFFGISLFWKYITGTNKRSLCVNGVGTLKKHFNQLNHSVKTLNNTFTMWGNLYWGSSTLNYFEIGKRYRVTLFNTLRITTLC